MYLEVTICCAFVFTLLAAERLFSGMNKMCCFKLPAVVNEEAHMGHLWVFSPPFFVLVWDVKERIVQSSVKNFLSIGVSYGDLPLFQIRLS